MADDFHSSQHHKRPRQRSPSPPQIHRPIPRRPTNFQQPQPSQLVNELADAPRSTSPHLNSLRYTRSSDFVNQLNARLLRNCSHVYDNDSDSGDERESMPPASPPRSGGGGSSQNLMMGSTLGGIYDDVDSITTGMSITDTPWGVGAETPARPQPHELDSGYFGRALTGTAPRNGGASTEKRRTILPSEPAEGLPPVVTPGSRLGQKAQRQGVWKIATAFGKMLSLFAFGSVYGIIVSHPHDRRELAAIRVGGVNRDSWEYSAGWGIAGLVLGLLLPYMDLLSGQESGVQERQTEQQSHVSESSLGEQLNEVVRSVGAFVGIAFAIRRLPWQSSLQLTLTLALVNPVLWYILDRSRNGLQFSLVITSVLTSAIFLSNPDVLPSPVMSSSINSTYGSAGGAGTNFQSPQRELFAGVVTYDNLATATWVGSVVFCSCICFGGIGRRLAVFDDCSLSR